jgi:hypothetical protein
MNKTEILSKLQSRNIKSKKISLGDCELIIKQLSGAEYIELNSYEDKKEFINHLISYCVYDSEDSKVFSQDDLSTVKSLNSDDYAKILNAVFEINNWLAGDRNKKNLKKTK